MNMLSGMLLLWSGTTALSIAAAVLMVCFDAGAGPDGHDVPWAASHNDAMPRRPVNIHSAYHAHVYFDAGSVAQARALCDEAGRRFRVAVGRVHEKLVGPHPRWSCQLAFSAAEFDRIVPWLEEHRGGLDVFVHGLSGDALKDHTDYAYWLGNEWPLDLRQFRNP